MNSFKLILSYKKQNNLEGNSNRNVWRSRGQAPLNLQGTRAEDRPPSICGGCEQRTGPLSICRGLEQRIGPLQTPTEEGPLQTPAEDRPPSICRGCEQRTGPPQPAGNLSIGQDPSICGELKQRTGLPQPTGDSIRGHGPLNLQGTQAEHRPLGPGAACQAWGPIPPLWLNYCPYSWVTTRCLWCGCGHTRSVTCFSTIPLASGLRDTRDALTSSHTTALISASSWPHLEEVSGPLATPWYFIACRQPPASAGSKPQPSECLGPAWAILASHARSDWDPVKHPAGSESGDGEAADTRGVAWGREHTT